jgi:hypothetical protein
MFKTPPTLLSTLTRVSHLPVSDFFGFVVTAISSLVGVYTCEWIEASVVRCFILRGLQLWLARLVRR